MAEQPEKPKKKNYVLRLAKARNIIKYCTGLGVCFMSVVVKGVYDMGVPLDDLFVVVAFGAMLSNLLMLMVQEGYFKTLDNVTAANNELVDKGLIVCGHNATLMRKVVELEKQLEDAGVEYEKTF